MEPPRPPNILDSSIPTRKLRPAETIVTSEPFLSNSEENNHGIFEVAIIKDSDIENQANTDDMSLEVEFPTTGPVNRILPPLLKTSKLKETYFVLPNHEDGKARIFIDRELPVADHAPQPNTEFPVQYFVDLHEQVAAASALYAANTPNHLGARVPLRHCKLRVDRWRHHLFGYDGIDICQLIEFGFPLWQKKPTSH